MSEIKVNKLTPRTNCGTTTLGDSGDTINIPAGVTISNNGTATGFGATGAVNWDVTSIKTVDFTAVSGVGYFVDTATTGAVIVTLPAAPSVGDVVGVADYANNFKIANCTLNRNSLKIGGEAINGTLNENGIAITLVYVDVTKGWIVTDSGNQNEAGTGRYIAASGGCITTCGNFKIHTFLSPGTFTVSCAGNSVGSNTVDYLVLAGGAGGGGGGDSAAGGGAGGYRFSDGSVSGCYTTASAPLVPLGASALPVSATPYPINVGAGGAGQPGSPSPDSRGINGLDSVFSSITSAGGGGGGGGPGGVGTPISSGKPGGSGGGAATSGGAPGTIGSGDTPPTTPPQGFDGGTGASDNSTYRIGGGGGGGGAVGQSMTNPVPTPTPAGVGGAGIASMITAASVTRGGGGGAGAHPAGQGPGAGGSGGGGAGAGPGAAVAGGCNTGGGGGGGANPNIASANGGSGIIIIRYKYK